MNAPHIIALSALMLAASPLASAADEQPIPSPAPTTKEADEFYTRASEFLKKSVNFDQDANASSHFVRRGRFTKIEWRNLVFRQLIMGSISPQEQHQGLRRRLYAQITSESYRLTDEQGSTHWRSGNCPGFPTYVMIEEIDGDLHISAPNIDQFSRHPQMTASTAVSMDKVRLRQH